jgi:site-specific DNA-methyltransferase (adenine-specific)
MLALCASIRASSGLKFHFIVVEQVEEEYFLRAGGRRFRAYELLSQGDETAWGLDKDGVPYTPSKKEKLFYSTIPCTILRDLSKADRLRIEYIENKGRKETTWQEDAPLIEAFHKEMQEKYGPARSGKGKDGWSVRDTAKELGINPSEVVHLLQLAEGLKKSPGLKDISRKSKALTNLKRTKNIEISDLLEMNDFLKDGVEVRCGDSKVELLKLEDNSVDLILTDPPWDIGFEERTMERRQENYQEYDKDYNTMDTLEVLTICYNKLKSNSGIYMFYSSFPEKVLEAQKLLTTAGFLVEQLPLIWYKKHVLAHDSRETRHNLNYETLLYAWKGERPLLNQPSRNVFEHQVAYANRIHASEKPESLLAELILLNTQHGDFVLDPFGGSCKVADACLSNKRRCLVVELEENLVKLANMRLRGL